MEATHTQPQIEGGPDVNAFFDSYRMAFDRLDSEDPMQGEISATASRRTRAEPKPIARYMARRRSVQATADWELLDRAGARLYTFAATYTLAKIEGALRIAALAHNEIPSYREYVSGRLAGGA